jgi:hypothetical protein
VLVSRFERSAIAWLAAALSFGVAARASAEDGEASEARDVPVGGFVDIEWRVMGLAEHASHGPAFAAGVTFLNGILRLGIGGLGRPGPINPATFDVALPEGTTYKGKRELSLKSDGAMVGGHVGLSFRMPFAEELAIMLPVTIGYGGFGFYLHGDDRDTPDGRRVSEWEDELFEGKDSFLGVVVDTGLRFGYQPADTPWFRPYVGAQFTIVPGFETMVRDDYWGFSGVLGIELGHGI